MSWFRDFAVTEYVMSNGAIIKRHVDLVFVNKFGLNKEINVFCFPESPDQYESKI